MNIDLKLWYSWVKNDHDMLWRLVTGILLTFVSVSCTSMEIVESPKTGYVADTAEIKDPAVIWSSRTLGQNFDYLGQVKVRSWTYESALNQLINGGRQLRADAITDIHYERVGFLKTMQAFAIKFK